MLELAAPVITKSAPLLQNCHSAFVCDWYPHVVGRWIFYCYYRHLRLFIAFLRTNRGHVIYQTMKLFPLPNLLLSYIILFSHKQWNLNIWGIHRWMKLLPFPMQFFFYKFTYGWRRPWRPYLWEIGTEPIKIKYELTSSKSRPRERGDGSLPRPRSRRRYSNVVAAAGAAGQRAPK